MEVFMKKLFGSILMFFLAINVNADTAKISSYYLVRSNVAQDMFVSIIDNENEYLKKAGFGISYMKDDGNLNSWVNYVSDLAMRNRTWYRSDIGAIYCTLLLSNTSRKYAVYTYITKADYYRSSSELFNIDYYVEVYEIIGFGNPYFWEN
jgi:hypothetical protein